MVAKITIPKSVEAALNYNEKKVQKGKAVCLHASNYLKDAKLMNFYQKLAGFERLNSLNERATTKALHVSLNFSPSEKLQDDKLLKIAELYMNKIGFGDQPFLVYKHEDAGHPHIHVVSTTIKTDGRRINTHNIGRNQSEKARKEIEQQFGLIKAEKQTALRNRAAKAVLADQVLYGKHETKRGISNAVGVVFSQYKFASLPEFNAALKQFNVIADQGGIEGRIFKNKGIVYRVLDAAGNKVGVPIKASSLGCRPILKNLKKKFEVNAVAKETHKISIKQRIDECLSWLPFNMWMLMEYLKLRNIQTVLRQNAEGTIYGITYVDNNSKCVFNGSDLGKGYSAAGIQYKLAANAKKETLQKDDTKDSGSASSVNQMVTQQKEQGKIAGVSTKSETPLDVLLSIREQYDNVPENLLKKKRKKKKQNL